MSDLRRFDKELVLENPRFDPDARIAMVSMPIPLRADPPTGLADLPTQVQPVGVWPQALAGQKRATRRQLMLVQSDQPLPTKLQITDRPNCPAKFDGPQITCRILDKKNLGQLLWEVNEAVFTFADRQFGLRIGLKHAGKYNWWQWVRIEQLWSGPLCKAIRIGGFIEVEHITDEDFAGLSEDRAASHPSIHNHNWLRGEVYALMFANGVVQLTCRHVNNHMFDHGRDLHDVLPVIGFTTAEATLLNETLDGTATRFDLGQVQLNLDQAATFFSREYPAKLAADDGVIIYQPYQGVHIFGDQHHRVRDDGFIVKAEEKVFPKGVARTVQFTAALGTAAPVISRLVIPDWYYAISREMWPDESLPVHDQWDDVVDNCQLGALEQAEKRPRCFDNAVLTVRGLWEGEIPYSQFLYFYRTGKLDFFDIGLNDAYHHADIGFDHATETLRMHHYPFGAIAQPLYRTVAMTYAYLETGDPYLLECSESAASRYYWLDRHNWPRRTYGRDAASLRSLIFLWDYTGKDDYLTMAREALGRAIQCQRPDGSTGDQGGAVGPCGGSAPEITKVWMAVMAAEPVVDYLTRIPDDQQLWQSLLKTAEFVLAAQLQKDGAYYWAYEYGYGDNPGNPAMMALDPENYERFPRRIATWGYKAKLLSFLTAKTGDTRFLEAWQKFHDTNWAIDEDELQQPDGSVIRPVVKKPSVPHYMSNKAVQNVPYAQAHKWNAQLTDDGVRIRPILTDWTPYLDATISTPWGPLHVKCGRSDATITIETRSPADFTILVEFPGSPDAQEISSNASATL